MAGGAAKDAYDPEKHHGAYDRRDQIADYADGGDADESKQPSAKHSADDAYYEVDHQAETSTTHQLAGNESGHDAYQYIPHETHDLLN